MLRISATVFEELLNRENRIEGVFLLIWSTTEYTKEEFSLNNLAGFLKFPACSF